MPEPSDTGFKAGTVKAPWRSITNAPETHKRTRDLGNEIGQRNDGDPGRRHEQARRPGRDNRSRVSERGADNRIHAVSAPESTRQQPDADRASGPCGKITEEPTFFSSWSQRQGGRKTAEEIAVAIFPNLAKRHKRAGPREPRRAQIKPRETHVHAPDDRDSEN